MKYEYKAVCLGSAPEMILNELGQESWELVTVTGSFAFLKRPLQAKRQVLNENEYVSS